MPMSSFMPMSSVHRIISRRKRRQRALNENEVDYANSPSFAPHHFTLTKGPLMKIQVTLSVVLVSLVACTTGFAQDQATAKSKKTNPAKKTAVSSWFRSITATCHKHTTLASNLPFKHLCTTLLAPCSLSEAKPQNGTLIKLASEHPVVRRAHARVFGLHFMMTWRIPQVRILSRESRLG